MPNLPDSSVEQALLPKLLDALDQVPGFAVEKHVIDNREPDHDARIELNAAGRPMVLLIECKREIFPLQAREVLWQFRHHLQSRYDVTPFVLARLHEFSGGATLRANIALALANAGLAAKIASSLAAHISA